MILELSYLSKKDEKLWDDYVLSHPNSTIFHLTGWKNVILQTYGFHDYYLIAKENDTIKGVLPLFLTKNMFFGKKLVSIPFAPYGGILSDNDEIETFLLNSAIKLTDDTKSQYLEIRTPPNYISTKCIENIIVKPMYMSSILDLEHDPELMLQKSFTRNKRKNIYKSQKQGLDWNWTNNTKLFYDLFVSNMTKLGSPCHSEKFFKNILSEFPDNSKILLVKKNEKVVYGAFYFYYKDVIINSWSSTLDEYRHFYPTDFGIWNAIKFGCINGYKYYDFGRSQIESNNLEFKRRWGANNGNLHSIFYLNNCSSTPNFTSTSSKRKLFAAGWKKIPHSIASSYGFHLRKKVP